jgi:hypothetical protein
LLEPSERVRNGYRTIEAFAQLLHTQEMVESESWTSKALPYVERPLHFARVAYDNNDADTIEKIHETIRLQWTNAHRQHREAVRGVTDSINAMFEQGSVGHDEDEKKENHAESGNGKLTPRELYPDVFSHERPSDGAYGWPHYNVKDSAPKRGDPGVEVKMEGVRMRIRKDGQEWMRLKTPAVVRQLRKEEAAAAQRGGGSCAKRRRQQRKQREGRLKLRSPKHQSCQIIAVLQELTWKNAASIAQSHREECRTTYYM